MGQTESVSHQRAAGASKQAAAQSPGSSQTEWDRLLKQLANIPIASTKEAYKTWAEEVLTDLRARWRAVNGGQAKMDLTEVRQIAHLLYEASGRSVDNLEELTVFAARNLLVPALTAEAKTLVAPAKIGKYTREDWTKWHQLLAALNEASLQAVLENEYPAIYSLVAQVDVHIAAYVRDTIEDEAANILTAYKDEGKAAPLPSVDDLLDPLQVLEPFHSQDTYRWQVFSNYQTAFTQVVPILMFRYLQNVSFNEEILREIATSSTAASADVSKQLANRLTLDQLKTELKALNREQLKTELNMASEQLTSAQLKTELKAVSEQLTNALNREQLKTELKATSDDLSKSVKESVKQNVGDKIERLINTLTDYNKKLDTQQTTNTTELKAQASALGALRKVVIAITPAVRTALQEDIAKLTVSSEGEKQKIADQLQKLQNTMVAFPWSNVQLKLDALTTQLKEHATKLQQRPHQKQEPAPLRDVQARLAAFAPILTKLSESVAALATSSNEQKETLRFLQSTVQNVETALKDVEKMVTAPSPVPSLAASLASAGAAPAPPAAPAVDSILAELRGLRSTLDRNIGALPQQIQQAVQTLPWAQLQQSLDALKQPESLQQQLAIVDAQVKQVVQKLSELVRTPPPVQDESLRQAVLAVQKSLFNIEQTVARLSSAVPQGLPSAQVDALLAQTRTLSDTLANLKMNTVSPPPSSAPAASAAAASAALAKLEDVVLARVEKVLAKNPGISAEILTLLGTHGSVLDTLKQQQQAMFREMQELARLQADIKSNVSAGTREVMARLDRWKQDIEEAYRTELKSLLKNAPPPASPPPESNATYQSLLSALADLRQRAAIPGDLQARLLEMDRKLAQVLERSAIPVVERAPGSYETLLSTLADLRRELTTNRNTPLPPPDMVPIKMRLDEIDGKLAQVLDRSDAVPVVERIPYDCSGLNAKRLRRGPRGSLYEMRKGRRRYCKRIS